MFTTIIWLLSRVLLSSALPSVLDVSSHSPNGQIIIGQTNIAQQEPIGNPRKLKGKFLHITDIHPDPFYVSGAKAGSGYRCHSGSGKKSGYYGAATTKCDSPVSLVNATFQWIQDNIRDEIDFVVWTGDSARHDNDKTIPRTSNQVANLNKFVVQKFTEVFGKRDPTGDPDPINSFIIPIIPNLGNNDILPHNIFTLGPNKWTTIYGDLWQDFIPQDQRHSFARGGWFWTEVIPNRLAVVSLNTLFFSSSNSAVDGCNSNTEPGYEHFEWLRVQLQIMRERGLKAILMGHVPPARTKSKQNWDETCYQKYLLWQRQFRDIIVANMYAHMNTDHFMFHDSEDLEWQIDDDNDRENIEGRGAGDFGIVKPAKNNNEVHVMGKAKYLNQLRKQWSQLPTPPNGTSYGSLIGQARASRQQERESGLKIKIPTSEKEFFEQIGGSYGERFSMSFVSPSVVPNAFPSLRIIEYNISGLENDHPALQVSQAPVSKTAVGVSQNRKVLDIRPDPMVSTKANKKKIPDFQIPEPPSNTSLPGPAYSPQTLSLLSWTQLYANVSEINQKIKAKMAVADVVNNANRNWYQYFNYSTEYTTHTDSFYHMPDLTVGNWLDLAEKIARTEYNTSKLDNDEDEDEDIDGMRSSIGAQKKRKHKEGQLALNPLWHEFTKRAYVNSKTEAELKENFD